jgi:hypothetical protein
MVIMNSRLFLAKQMTRLVSMLSGIVAAFLVTAFQGLPQANAQPASQADRQTQNVIVITLDGLRWQELFGGADQRLMSSDGGGVKDEDALRTRFWRESAVARREQLMPFFWSTIVPQGQVFGDPDHGSIATVTNGRFFSYPGYNEILCGFGDPAIDSNDKKPNPNVSVLEFLNRMPQYEGRVAAWGSWDVFPYILHEERSKVFVNAGWEPIVAEGSADQWLVHLDQVARELPHVWPSVRYDVFTLHGALAHMKSAKPRVLYVALGETDDWAHEGRYDLYLDAAQRNDQYIRTLWETAQSLPFYANKTSLVITTDHGRGDGREGWKSHGTEYPGSDRIWIAVMGPDTQAQGLRENLDVTQAQVAATVASLLGEDFTKLDPRIAKPLPGVTK